MRWHVPAAIAMAYMIVVFTKEKKHASVTIHTLVNPFLLILYLVMAVCVPFQKPPHKPGER